MVLAFVQKDGPNNKAYQNYHWKADVGNSRRVEWQLSTTVGDSRKYKDRWAGGEDPYISLTVGRWHHLAMSADRYVMTVFMDGLVQWIYPFSRATERGALPEVQKVMNSILYTGETGAPHGNKIHDIRYFTRVALEQNQILAIRDSFPRSVCGDGIVGEPSVGRKILGEECDDGNRINNDGCDSSCRIEDNWFCLVGNTTSLGGSKCMPSGSQANQFSLTFEKPMLIVPSEPLVTVDESVYNPADWSRSVHMPRFEESFLRYTETDDIVETVRRRGQIKVDLHKDFARAGNKGMRLLIRNRWYSAPADPDDLPENSRTDVLGYGSTPSYDWKDRRTGGTVQDKTVLQYASSSPEQFHNWHYVKLTNLLPDHSAIVVKLRLWTAGFCTGSAVAIDVDGDTIFAHVSDSDGGGKFTDSLRNGGYRTQGRPSMYVYTHPKGGMDSSGVQNAETTHGLVLPVLWKKAELSDNPPSGSADWFYWDVEAVAPHSNIRSGATGLARDSDTPDPVTINVRSVSDKHVCSMAQHAFSELKVQTYDAGPVFRAENRLQTTNILKPNTPYYTWMQFDPPGLMTPDTTLSYSFKIARWPQFNRAFVVLLMDRIRPLDMQENACQSPVNCGSQSGCSACRQLPAERHDPDYDCYGDVDAVTGVPNCRIYYKVCYSTDGYPHSCDETTHPTYGVWHDESIKVSQKLAFRYKQEDALQERPLRVHFGFWATGGEIGGSGDDSEMEVHFDNIRVTSPMSGPQGGLFGCANVEVKSYAVGTALDKKPNDAAQRTAFWVGGFVADQSAAQPPETCRKCRNFLNSGEGGCGNDDDNPTVIIPCKSFLDSSCDTLRSGFATMVIPRKKETRELWIDDELISCFNPATASDLGFKNAVEKLDFGDRFLVASYGLSSKCHYVGCAPAFRKIGAPEITWSTGFSMGLIGRKGALVGAIPMQLELNGEGDVTAKSKFLCPDVELSVTETTYQYGAVSPAMALMEKGKPLDARFKLQTHTGGYLGCYRGISSSTQQGWTSTSRGFSGDGKPTRASPSFSDVWAGCSVQRHFLTPSTCSWCCESQGYTIAAVKYNTCRCGDNYGNTYCDPYGECGVPNLPDTNCEYPCHSADTLQSCGGWWWGSGASAYNGRHDGPKYAIYTTTGAKYLLPEHVGVSTTTGTSGVLALYDNDRKTQVSTQNADYVVTLDFTQSIVDRVHVSAVRIYWCHENQRQAQQITIDVYDPGFAASEPAQWNDPITYDNSQQNSHWTVIRITGDDKPRASKIKVTLSGLRNGYHCVGDILVNYFELADGFTSKFDHLSAAYDVDAGKMLAGKYTSAGTTGANLERLSNKDYTTAGAHYHVKNFFRVSGDGTVFVNAAIFNYEGAPTYKLDIAAYANGYERQLLMRAQSPYVYIESESEITDVPFPSHDGDGNALSEAAAALAQAPSYIEINNPLGLIPGIVKVGALSQRTGRFYAGIGVVQADERFDTAHGGVLFGISKTKLRLWVPKASFYFKSGYTVNINEGWGVNPAGKELLNEGWSNDGQYEHGAHESTRQAQVQVTLRKARPPEFDSGWLPMSSNSMTESYREIDHKLGLSRALGGKNILMDVADVKVTYRSTQDGGPNEGFVFTATGSQQGDASGGKYGGIVYSYNNKYVRLWAPNFAGMTHRLDIESIKVRYMPMGHYSTISNAPDVKKQQFAPCASYGPLYHFRRADRRQASEGGNEWDIGDMCIREGSRWDTNQWAPTTLRYECPEGCMVRFTDALMEERSSIYKPYCIAVPSIDHEGDMKYNYDAPCRIDWTVEGYDDRKGYLNAMQVDLSTGTPALGKADHTGDEEMCPCFVDWNTFGNPNHRDYIQPVYVKLDGNALEKQPGDYGDGTKSGNVFMAALQAGQRLSFSKTQKFDGMRPAVGYNVPAGELTSIPMPPDPRIGELDARGATVTCNADDTDVNGVEQSVAECSADFKNTAVPLLSVSANEKTGEVTLFHPELPTAPYPVGRVVFIKGGGKNWECKAKCSNAGDSWCKNYGKIPGTDVDDLLMTKNTGTFDGKRTVIASTSTSFTFKYDMAVANECKVSESFKFNLPPLLGDPIFRAQGTGGSDARLTGGFFENSPHTKEEGGTDNANSGQDRSSPVIQKHRVQSITTSAPTVHEQQTVIVHNTDPEGFRTVGSPGNNMGLMRVESDEWKYFDCEVQNWKKCDTDDGVHSCSIEANVCTKEEDRRSCVL